MILHEFLTDNREELVERCRAKVAKRPSPQPTDIELQHGIPLFLDQLIKTLRLEQIERARAEVAKSPVQASTKLLTAAEIGNTAVKHGNELLRKGYTIDQVVRDYGDLCQAVTEIAVEKEAPVTVDEFRTLNRCLDNAIAGAVTEFGRQRDQIISEQGAQAMNERLGCLAHEQRNLLNSAMLAFQAIKSGNVAITGATGNVLDRSLIGLSNLIDRALAEVRLIAGLEMRLEPIAIREFLEEVQVSAAMEAKDRGLELTISPGVEGLAVEADPQMLWSAVSNLLQNAFKFTRPHGRVSVKAHAVAERVVIEVQDECGGLPPGKTEKLFLPFEQRGGDRSGLGLGLSISRRAIEANGGKLAVRNLAGMGCVFTIELPRPPTVMG